MIEKFITGVSLLFVVLFCSGALGLLLVVPSLWLLVHVGTWASLLWAAFLAVSVCGMIVSVDVE